jgi:hypothetical protein
MRMQRLAPLNRSGIKKYMERQLFSMILAASLLLFNACSKHKDEANNGLSGKWEYVSATGGYAGNTIYPNGTIILQLNSNLSYALYRNNIFKENGHYYLDTVQNNVKIHFDGALFVDPQLQIHTWSLFNHTASEFTLYPDRWADMYAYKMRRKGYFSL